MHTFMTTPRLLCTAMLMVASLTACQQTPTPAPKAAVVQPVAPASPAATIVSSESLMTPQQIAELPRNILVPPAAPVISDDPLAVQIKSIDRSDLNARISLLGKYARHYPPRFETKRARRAAEAEATDLATITTDAANGPKPTFEQLIQAVKANCLAHNMDVGNNTAGNANTFIRSALKLKPNDGEANFLYGVLLSESGGMKEGLPYLNKSAKAGFNESYLSLANAYLSLNQKPKALAPLASYKKVVPDDPHYDDMVDAVKTNKASIW